MSEPGAESTSGIERADGLIHALSTTVGPHFTEKSERIVHRFLDDMIRVAEVERLRAENASMNRAVDRLEEVGIKREEENRALADEVQRLRDELQFFADGGYYQGPLSGAWLKVDFALQCRARQALQKDQPHA